MKSKYRIAIYLRLSKEDEDCKAESNSILMQRMLLKKYAADRFSEYDLVEFCDDGYTGTNFNRPGMQEMLELIRNSEIDCIIVKDFSRFARDYIELGTYLEQIFPFLRIRFISVNDHYDSKEYHGSIADLDVNFKNLLYDLYSKDLSQKVKASLTVKKAQGKYISGNSPFGYEKSPDDRHMLLMEEDEAEIVRRIFELTLAGHTSSQIARDFNTYGVKTPIQYKIKKGKTSRMPKGDRFHWNTAVICQILQNPIYVGDIEYGKYEKDFVGGKNHLKPREEWKIYHNHHQPIISREVFQRVQEGRGKKRNAQFQESHVLIGKTVCACCGKNLSYRSRNLNPYFTCALRYCTDSQGCVVKINGMLLEQYVLFQMQEQIAFGQEEKRRIEEQNTKIREEIKKIEHRKSLLMSNLAKTKRQNMESYENYALGKTKEYHQDNQNITQMESELARLESEIKKLAAGMSRNDNDEELYAILSKEQIDRYIERIVIANEQDIRIEWKSNKQNCIH